MSIADTGIVVGDSTILWTGNGGATWAPDTSIPGTRSGAGVAAGSVLPTIYHAAALDRESGFACTAGNSGAALVSTDHGVTWADKSTGVAYDILFVAMRYPIIVLVGRNSCVVVSTDGGETWQAGFISHGGLFVAGRDLNAVEFKGNVNEIDDGRSPFGAAGKRQATDLELIAVGAYGRISTSADTAKTWTSRSEGISRHLNGVHRRGSRLWATGESGMMLFSPDSGANWETQSTGVTNSMNAVSFNDSDSGWAVGSSGRIIRTTDGGTTWTNQTGGGSATLYDVAARGVNSAWIVGSSGTILNTTDGGANWESQTSGTTTGLFGVGAADETAGWVVGSSGTILRTTDGGANWETQTSNTSATLRSVFCHDGSTASVVGSNGTILKTTDGGATWETQATPTTEYLRTVAFADASTGWAAGWNGTLLKTENGGTNWTIQSSGTGNDLEGLATDDARTAWLVGEGGTILHTSTGGGVTAVEPAGNAPVSFLLLQNYPNPFNPSTTIEYHVASEGVVVLDIYDVLGRRVKRLVNEFQTAGSKSVLFDAENLSSGMYLVRLSMGSLSETRKMVLSR